MIGDRITVKPGDLPRCVDAIGIGVNAAWEIDRRVGAAAVEEAVRVAASVGVIPDDLSRRVDAIGKAAGAAWGINRRVGVG